jgi:lipopolysaccharide/colanic/teichoic acid biosynthesis glycosyltransferase
VKSRWGQHPIAAGRVHAVFSNRGTKTLLPKPTINRRKTGWLRKRTCTRYDYLSQTPPCRLSSMNPTQDDIPRQGSLKASSSPIPTWKRTLDITCILVALPLLTPLLLILAVIIKAGSKGSVLYRQQRVGFRGQRFTCFKFRTMASNADTLGHEEHCQRLIESNTPMVKMDSQGDSRVAPLGRVLRATGLDELPQLINVFRGEMSLVGPRPCLPCEYDRHLPWQKERFRTSPGITGLWQVSGKNRTTFSEMIHLDIRYGQNRSPWLDVKILFRTIPALIVQMHEMRNGRITTVSGQSGSTTGSYLSPNGHPLMFGQEIAVTAAIPVESPVLQEETWPSR